MQEHPTSDSDFPFTREEMECGFRLIEDETTAAEDARAVIEAYKPGMTVAASNTTIILLYLGSESGRTKVDAMRARGAYKDVEGGQSWEERVEAVREVIRHRNSQGPRQ